MKNSGKFSISALKKQQGGKVLNMEAVKGGALDACHIVLEYEYEEPDATRVGG